MTGPAFAELTYFEKTYGEPSNKFSHPEKGTADSYWRFSDGGEAHAEERKAESDKFTIRFTIQASDSALRPGPLAANPQTPLFNGWALGESWQKFAQTEVGWKYAYGDEETTQARKDVAAGKSRTFIQQDPDLIKASFTFASRRLTRVILNTREPKFVELDYLDETYGHPYSTTNVPVVGGAQRRWDYADGGQVLATEVPAALSLFNTGDAHGFVITISAETIPPQ